MLSVSALYTSVQMNLSIYKINMDVRNQIESVSWGLRPSCASGSLAFIYCLMEIFDILLILDFISRLIFVDSLNVRQFLNNNNISSNYFYSVCLQNWSHGSYSWNLSSIYTKNLDMTSLFVCLFYQDIDDYIHIVCPFPFFVLTHTRRWCHVNLSFLVKVLLQLSHLFIFNFVASSTNR